MYFVYDSAQGVIQAHPKLAWACRKFSEQLGSPVPSGTNPIEHAEGLTPNVRVYSQSKAFATLASLPEPECQALAQTFYEAVEAFYEAQRSL